ncbi:YcxB family protein [Streptacidiphilus sp. EB129]|uniref:YcxB family protein n=1 Tax=Streptacidiphilus sp. EB129 TaxID=3156262 RepID=UPI00351699AE
MNLALSYELSMDEFRRAVLAMTRRPRRVLWTATAVTFVVGALLLALDATILGSVFLAGAVFYVFLLTVRTGANVRKQAARVCRPTRVTLTETHCTFENDLERGEITWAAIVRAEETSACFLLYRAPRMANIVPKRAFTPDQLAAFSAFLAARAADSAHGRPAATGPRATGQRTRRIV